MFFVYIKINMYEVNLSVVFFVAYLRSYVIASLNPE